MITPLLLVYMNESMKIFTKGGNILDENIHDTMFPENTTRLQVDQTIAYMNEKGLPDEEIIRRAMSICLFIINNINNMPEDELKEKMKQAGYKV